LLVLEFRRRQRCQGIPKPVMLRGDALSTPVRGRFHRSRQNEAALGDSAVRRPDGYCWQRVPCSWKKEGTTA